MSDEQGTPGSMAPPVTSPEHDRSDMSRRDFLVGAAAAATASAFRPSRSAPHQTATRSAERSLPHGYNIMFITVDKERFFQTYAVPHVRSLRWFPVCT
jgi:hypothetical protein